MQFHRCRRGAQCKFTNFTVLTLCNHKFDPTLRRAVVIEFYTLKTSSIMNVVNSERYVAKRKAACRCGQVEFELTGESSHKGCGPRCHCNDCITAAIYVNNKALAANHENISVLENGNPQGAHYVFHPIANIRLVKGGDKIAKYRLRATTKTIRTYTTCCHTIVVSMLGADSLGIKLPKMAVVNYNTITPAIECSKADATRIQCKEAARPKELPNDGIANNLGIPFGFIFVDVFNLCFASTTIDDAATRALLYSDPRNVTEIAGADACKCIN